MGALKSNVAVKLGIISFSVSVESAVSEVKEGSFNQVCTGAAGKPHHPPARVRQSLKCGFEGCANDDKETFLKGKEIGGVVKIVPQSEIDAAGASDEVKKNIALTTHPAEQAEHMLQTGKVYNLSPAAGHAETYALVAALVEARSDLAFFTEFAVRSLAAMYRLIAQDGVLMLLECAWPENVKAKPIIHAEINEAMLGQASVFADMLKADFDPDTYRDKRTAQIAAFMATLEGEAPAAVEGATGVSTPKTDLSTMLNAAISAAGAAKAPAKKTAAKKAVAKKATAKKATTRKAS